MAVAGAPADDATESTSADPDPDVAAAPDAGEADVEGAPDDAAAGSGWPVRVDRLELRDLALHMVDPRGAHTRYVDLDLEALRLGDFHLDEAGGIALGEIGIERPLLRIRRELVEPGTAAPAPETAPAEPAPALRLDVERLAVERAEFTLLTAGEPLDVALELEATGVNAGLRRFPVDLALEVAGGRVALRGELGLAPLVFDGRLELDGVDLAPLAAAADPRRAPWFQGGRASAQLALALRVDASPEAGVRASGPVSVRDLRVAPPEGEDFAVAWQRLDVAVDALAVSLAPGAGPPQIELGSVALLAPKLRYTLPADALAELAGDAPEASADAPADAAQEEAAEAAAERAGESEGDALADAPADATGDPAAAPADDAGGPRIRVATLEVREGAIDFADRTVAPTHRSAMRALRVDARDVRWPEGSAASFDARARLPGRAPVRLSGRYAPGDGAIDLELEGMDLEPFNGYARGAGLEVRKGEASLSTRVRLSGTKVRARSDLVLHRLGVASAGGGAVDVYGVSLDLALALLRDVDGDITLPIPVDADEGQVRAGFWSVLGGAVREAFLGALAAPVKVAGGAVELLTGGGEVEVEPLRAAPGEAAPAPGEDARLAELAALLASRPGLQLALRGHADAGDRPVVAERLLREAVAGDGDVPPAPDAGFLQQRRLRAALRERAAGGPGALEADDRAALERWIAAVDVPEERLDDLADARAAAVRDRLVDAHGADPNRIVLRAPAGGDAGVVFALEPATGASLPAVAAPPAEAETP